MNVTLSALPKLVYGVVRTQPAGMKHAEVVREIRRQGYTFDGPPGLSATIHSILTDLVTSGEIVRNENANMERRYQLASRENRLRILVVDDNMDHADSVATILKYAGYDVKAVYSGSEALEAVSWNPNLVLLDIGMPNMDGYDTARSLRNRIKDRLTLVAMTGREDRRASKDAGFDYHVVKPVEDQDLLETVEAGTYPYEEPYKGRLRTLKEEFA